ncbi:MAG: hypothetical protein GC129_01340 [Proteobacteria bacterium]|nr:hypothetical protein [Pseudomonadota bacterium]
MRWVLVLAGAGSLAMSLSGCAPDAPTIPCPVCYEDAWSKEPFPGEEKQHIPTVDMREQQQQTQKKEPQ